MIHVIDYQMGNLRSVQKGFEKVGHEAVISSDARAIGKASKLVLPGVGAFRDAIRELRTRGLVEPVRDAIHAGTPFLGICLGLQLLFDVSYEGGEHEGLGIIPGKVVRFEIPPEYKVPHMGWNETHFQSLPELTLGIPNGAWFYYVHSFFVKPDDPTIVAATADYPQPFCAMIARDRLYATQFHPEKSQSNGLRLLKNFGDLNAAVQQPVG